MTRNINAWTVLISLAFVSPVFSQATFETQTIADNTLGQALDPSSVYSIDLDGDGDIDIISASSGDNRVVWYENNGNEGFSARVLSETASHAISVFAIDLDGDGDIDVLSASQDDDTIAWFENDGNQQFSYQIISSIANGAQSVFAIDLDDDGDMDVLSASGNDDKIAWYQNDGNQAFTEHVISTDTDFATDVFALDIDGDDDLDVLSASQLDDKVTLHINDGTEGFTTKVITLNADNVQSVSAADLDNDGDPDILVASYDDDTIEWFENRGGNVFIRKGVTTAANGAIDVFAKDIDGDGDLDIVSAANLGGEVTWYRNNGNKTFTGITIDASAGGASSVHLDDINGDGEMDILATTQTDDNVIWYQNDGNNNFTKSIVNTGTDGARDVFAVDIDGDSDLDILSAAEFDDKVSWFENEGDNNFTEQTISALVDDVEDVFAIDLDKDGDMDVLSIALWVDNLVWYENDGDASFTRHVISTNVFGGHAVYAADVDGDGDIDVLSASASDNKIAWYQNDGNQIFMEQPITSNAFGARSVFAIDVDSDGDMDVLSASSGDDKIAWYQNDGVEGFSEHVISTDADNAYAVYAIDIDRDGDIDVLSASQSDDKIAWYENDGDQSFTERVISDRADGAFDVYVTDVDGDGFLDVLSAASFNDEVVWYKNDGDQSFTEQVIATDADAARAVFAVDMDNDGNVDVLSASINDDRIVLYDNQNPAKTFDLSLLSAGETEISLAWSAADGAASYTIYRDTESPAVTEIASGVTGASFTDTGLSGLTTYYYRIRATNSSGSSIFSNEISPSTIVLMPPVISSVSHSPILPEPDQAITVVATVTDDNLNAGLTTLIWRVNNVLQAEVNMNLVDAEASLYRGTITSQGNLANVTYWITAEDLTGEQATSEMFSFQVKQDEPPAVPSNRTIAVVGGSKVRLNWTSAGEPDLAKFYIRRDDALYDSVDADQSSWDDVNVSRSVVYAYQIYARDVAGNESGYGAFNEVSVPPAAPHSQNVSTTFSSIEFTWEIDDGSNITEYQVFRKTGTASSTQIATTTALIYTDNDVVSGTSYTYDIYALDNLSVLSEALSFSARADDNDAPDTPINLSVTISSISRITLAWTSSGEADLEKFLLYRNDVLFDSVDVDQNSWVDTTVDRSVLYAYEIYARDDVGSLSAAGQFVATSIPPAVPFGVFINTGVGSIQFSWQATDVDAIAGYQIYRAEGEEDSTQIGSSPTLSFTDNAAIPGTPYAYFIFAQDSLLVKSEAFSFSAESESVADLEAPNNPTNVTGIAGADFVAISWEENQEIDLQGYQLWRNGWADTLFITASLNTFTDRNVLSDSTYNYTVSSVDFSGNASPWIDISATPFTYEPTFAYAISNDFFPKPETEHDYRMISLPGDDNKPLGDVLMGEFGEDWKAYYENGKPSDDSTVYLTPYTSSNTKFSFVAGRAFWILSETGWVANTFTTAADNVILTDKSTAKIAIHSGWNIIGNPFKSDVSWASVIEENDSLLQVSQNLQNIWSWSGNAYGSAKEMKPYAGYYFYNDTELTELDIPHPNRTTVTAATSIQSAQFLHYKSRSSNHSEIALDLAPAATITVSSNDNVGQVQLRQQASQTEASQFSDQFAPPGHFAEITLRIKDEDNHQAYPWLTEKVLTANDDDLKLTLILNTPANANITFTINNIDQLIGTDESVALVNQSTGKSWNLKEQAEFGVDIIDATTSFALLIGSAAFVSEKTASFLPQTFSLDANYPNPFASSTQIGYSLPETSTVTLEIYDILGRRVETLVNATIDAGYHQIQWKAEGLSNGIYFYRLSAGGFVHTRKMIVVR